MKLTYIIQKLPLAMAIVVAAIGLDACSNQDTNLQSPSGDVKVAFKLNADGQPEYAVSFQGEEIIKPSTMGFELLDGSTIAKGFKIDKVTHSSADSYWVPVWGENDSIRDHYNAMTVAMTDEAGVKLNIEFRVYDDGAAYRYVFP